MATYEQIQEWLKIDQGISVKTCWIAHVKELCGLPLRGAPNRRRKKRMNPCPEDRVASIKKAFRRFGMIR